MRPAYILLFAVLATAAQAELRQPEPGVHALLDVRIIPAPGEVIDNGHIVWQDGVIVAVGAGIDIPDAARRHHFERGEDDPPVTVYAGLIDSYVPLEPAGEDNGQPEIPPGRHALIRPDFRAGAADWPEQRLESLRAAGITTIVLAPAEGLLRGQGVIANIGDGGLHANRLPLQAPQFASLEDRAQGRNFPNSLMGAVALVRQTLADAAWQQHAQQAWMRNPAQPRPQWLEGLDALAPVLSGAVPLVFDAQDALDSLRILELLHGHELALTLVGHGHEYQRLAALRAAGVPHILPLDFPEAPDVRDEQDRDVGLEALRDWRMAPENPARLADAGIPLMFTSHGQSQPADLLSRVHQAMEHGLDADAALAALTTTPAEWLGMTAWAGRIAPGHQANLVVVEGELFAESPSLMAVWIDGRHYALSALAPPEVDPAGTWAMTLNLGSMGEVDGTLKLSGPPRNMDGTLTVMGNDTPLSSVRVSGSRVQIRIDAAQVGGSGTIAINLDIDGDRARGTGSGPFGEFTLRGRRTAQPDEEVL